MMRFHSIRWRLPLSYAAIALVAALSLGIVLLITLRNHYAQQERLYLIRYAEYIGASLAPLMTSELHPSVIQAQVNNLASFSQSRVRVLDLEGNLLADSGDPSRRDILAFSPIQLAVRPPDTPLLPQPLAPFDAQLPALSGADMIVIYGNAPGAGEITSSAPFSGTLGLVSSIPASFMSSDLEFDAPIGSSSRRSLQEIRLSITDSSGRLLGSVDMSDGPAYGWQIVNRVALTWLFASTIAVLLAAGVGWVASRRVTMPLMELTHVTTRMAEGDLSARAKSDQPDEFGALGSSFNEMATRIEQTVLTLRQFVADAAHELHTPLTALRTNLELAVGEESGAITGAIAGAMAGAMAQEDLDRRGDPDDVDRHRMKQTTVLERAQAQVERLSQLSQGLLDLSRIEAGSNGENRTAIDLPELVREASEPFAAQAEQAGQAFTLQIQENVSTISGNEAQLRRALGNLLDNALKFTPPGGAVNVRLYEEAGEIHLEVEDNGIGIPEEDLEQLFQRFHRGRNASAYPGSGLGLAIVRAIAQAHGGRVQAENLPAGGARFSLSFPAGV